MSWQVRLSTLLVYCYSKDITAILACVGRHFASVASLSLCCCSLSLAVSCCAVHCLVLLMAACRQCCLAVPAGSALSTVPPLLALLDCPLSSLCCSSLGPARPDCPLSLFVTLMSLFFSRLFCIVDCPILRVLVVVEDSLWQTVRVLLPPAGCSLASSLLASVDCLLGCPFFACVVHHLFCDRFGVPTGSRCPGFVCVSRWSILLCIRGVPAPRVVSLTLVSIF